jgi:hypothetical protein
MPVSPLPSNPNLGHLKNQAKDLLRRLPLRQPEIAQKIREFHPRCASLTDARIFATSFSLVDAQLVIARERGFATWARLKRHVENPTVADQLHLPHHQRIEDRRFRRAVDLLDVGDVEGLRALLKQYPELVRQHVDFEGGNYFRSPTLLEFVAENPIRHGKLPANIVAIAGVILAAGADQSSITRAAGLVATGRVTRDCGVQTQLLDLLCEHGADPQAAIHGAAGGGEHEAAIALIRRGAKIDLPVAAALGLFSEFNELFPSSTAKDRHLALAMAARFGHAELVSLLLRSGEEPSRYNPPGFHAHSTPLHTAALAGHLEVVAMLVDAGARLDLRDVLWQATPADWAAHEGRFDVEKYLRTREADARQQALRNEDRHERTDQGSDRS